MNDLIKSIIKEYKFVLSREPDPDLFELETVLTDEISQFKKEKDEEIKELEERIDELAMQIDDSDKRESELEEKIEDLETVIENIEDALNSSFNDDSEKLDEIKSLIP